MEYGRRPGGLRNLIYYLPRTVKFYELKNEAMARAIFIIILAISFAGQLIMISLYPEDLVLDYTITEAGLESLYNYIMLQGVVSFATYIPIYLLLVVYQMAFLRELKHEEYTFAHCLRFVLSNLLRVVFAFVLYMMLAVLGAFFFIIPLFIVFVMFSLNTCYIVDKKCGILESFKASRYATKGSRLQIFGAFALLYLFLLLTESIVATSGNMMIYAFVVSFLSTIFNLMHQRLTALMYMDLEYGYIDKEAS